MVSEGRWVVISVRSQKSTASFGVPMSDQASLACLQDYGLRWKAESGGKSAGEKSRLQRRRRRARRGRQCRLLHIQLRRCVSLTQGEHLRLGIFVSGNRWGRQSEDSGRLTRRERETHPCSRSYAEIQHSPGSAMPPEDRPMSWPSPCGLSSLKLA